MRYTQDNFQDPMPKIIVGIGAFLLLVAAADLPSVDWEWCT